MVRIIIMKEIRESLLNRRFLAIASFSVLLLVLSGVVNYEYYIARKASFDTQFAEFAREKEDSDLRAYRPPALLSVLARGTEPYMPLYFGFGTHDASLGQVTPGNIEAEDFRLLAALGSLDFLFLVQIVFSLLAVLLSFDMVAGEKERGTLKAMLSNSVPRDKVILGKAVGGVVVLMIVFLLGTLLLFATLTLLDARFLSSDVLGRGGAIILTSAAYIAGFFMVGIMVSSLCHSGRTAIVALLVVWVTLQLVIPKLAETFATVSRPVRSEEAIRVEKAAVIEEIGDRKMDEGGDMFKRIFQTEHLNSGLINEETPEGERFREEYRRLTSDLNTERATRLRAIDEEYERELRAQRSLSYSLSLLSPSAAYGFMVSDFAGTGDLAYERFQDSASEYYSQLVSGPLMELTTQTVRVRIGGSSVWMDSGDQPDWDNVPVYSPASPGLGQAIKAHTWAAISLGLYLFVPFLVAYVGFLRYDVR